MAETETPPMEIDVRPDYVLEAFEPHEELVVRRGVPRLGEAAVNAVDVGTKMALNTLNRKK